MVVEKRVRSEKEEESMQTRGKHTSYVIVAVVIYELWRLRLMGATRDLNVRQQQLLFKLDTLCQRQLL